MKSSSSAKLFAVAALAVAGFGAASAAHAQSDVYFSVGVQGAPFYVEPAPVYVQPRPVYVQRRHVYVEPQPVYGQYRSEADRGWRRDAYNREYRRYDDRHARRFGPYGDLDHDGIMNRDDRDRDGDGVRNRYDHFPDNPYRN